MGNFVIILKMKVPDMAVDGEESYRHHVPISYYGILSVKWKHIYFVCLDTILISLGLLLILGVYLINYNKYKAR